MARPHATTKTLASASENINDAPGKVEHPYDHGARLSAHFQLTDAVSNVRGAVMICYPMGLPDFDHVRQILEEREVSPGARLGTRGFARSHPLSTCPLSRSSL